mmetsp:Transcript_76214/g.181311  ORF Transcript_76214/g.181311 Transcript_76214/m.181311 type:complete len:215 (-) Transcript_76214:889-1533(-)
MAHCAIHTSLTSCVDLFGQVAPELTQVSCTEAFTFLQARIEQLCNSLVSCCSKARDLAPNQAQADQVLGEGMHLCVTRSCEAAACLLHMRLDAAHDSTTEQVHNCIEPLVHGIMTCTKSVAEAHQASQGVLQGLVALVLEVLQSIVADLCRVGLNFLLNSALKAVNVQLWLHHLVETSPKGRLQQNCLGIFVHVLVKTALNLAELLSKHLPNLL